MASTYSDLKIELIGTGEQVGTWGSTTNTNLGTALEEAITGSADVAFSSADVTLTLTNTNGTQTARHLRLNLTGTSGGARNLILGSGCQIEKLYLVQNNLADTVTIKNTTGTGVAIPAGKKQFVFNNGTDVIEATNALVNLATDVTGTLPTANGGTGSTSTQFVNLATNVTGALPIANGGTGATVAATALSNLGGVTQAGARSALSFVAGSGAYNSSTGVITIPTNTNQLTNGAGFTTNTGTVTSVSGTGSASGLTLSGTVVSSGNITLSGTVNSLAAGTYGINITGTVNSLALSRGAGSSTTNNVAVGVNALSANTTGTDNTAVGSSALFANTSGEDNTAVGRSAVQNNTTGVRNTAVGEGALLSNTSGNDNSAVGREALKLNTTGFRNVAVGSEALQSSTTAFYNTAVGAGALKVATNGGNTAVGDSSLTSNTTGFNNTSTGLSALSANTTGSENTAVGTNALGTNTTGSNNTGIGYEAKASSATVSNTITLGNSSITTLRCQVQTITSLSDARDKTNVVDIPAGLSFVQALRPVSFEWNMRDGAKVGVPEFGFIAQELQAVQAETGIIVPNLVYDDNPDKLEASTGILIPVLVKAIQELNAKVEAQAIEINLLKERS
jgi:hypothetical protein